MKDEAGKIDEYIFQYPLTKCNSIHLSEMLRQQLQNLLEVIIPCNGNEEVKIDGFKIMNNKNIIHSIFISGEKTVDLTPEIKNVSLYEPRIELIKKQLESVLAVVEVTYNGKKVTVNGFELKNLSDWTVPSGCDPEEIFEHVSTRCNCDCIFCYNKGNPKELALVRQNKDALTELNEIKTRIKYFSPPAKKSLFISLGSCGEVLCHPYIIEILSLLRQKTIKPFRFNTNGTTLTKEMINQLVSYAPVYLDISLHSVNPLRRKKLMKDNNPEIAISALPLLRKKGIPFAIVIVPWPIDSLTEMYRDLEETIHYVAAHDAHHIQISLPGYTKYFPTHCNYDFPFLWKDIIMRVQRWRKEIDCPIVVMPTMYEENFTCKIKNRPEVVGLVKNSPAALSGLQKGDIIKKINDLEVKNRPQARDMLAFLHQNEIPQVRVTVFRNNSLIEIEIDAYHYRYPYLKYTDSHMGIIFMGTGFRTGYLEKLKEIIQRHKAKHVLLITSILVKPVLEQCLNEVMFFNQVKLDLIIPPNIFFGGNIFMGDLLVVEDFIYCLKEYIKEKEIPDLVVIPSSPFNISQWGRDLTGRVYLDIERETGVPVELLDCATIYD